MQLLYEVKQKLAQLEMTNALSNYNTRFDILSILLSDFKNKINENEISINGKLYDISSFVIKGTTVQLVVVNDEKEEGILKKIKELITGTNKHSQLPTKLLHLLVLNYILPHSTFKFKLPQLTQQKCFSYCCKIISVSAEVSSPPPKFI